MLKFRTMVADAEERLGELVDLEKLEEPAFKIADDPRVTRAGRILRRFSLDELPQLVNVLRGDMSLVGPRPEEEAVVALYDERQRVRLAVKPGLTGPMQVYGRGDLTFEERLAMERDYLDNLSVAGDLAILLRTPRAIVRGEGAYRRGLLTRGGVPSIASVRAALAAARPASQRLTIRPAPAPIRSINAVRAGPSARTATADSASGSAPSTPTRPGSSPNRSRTPAAFCS